MKDQIFTQPLPHRCSIRWVRPRPLFLFSQLTSSSTPACNTFPTSSFILEGVGRGGSERRKRRALKLGACHWPSTHPPRNKWQISDSFLILSRSLCVCVCISTCVYTCVWWRRGVGRSGRKMIDNSQAWKRILITSATLVALRL